MLWQVNSFFKNQDIGKVDEVAAEDELVTSVAEAGLPAVGSGGANAVDVAAEDLEVSDAETLTLGSGAALVATEEPSSKRVKL